MFPGLCPSLGDGLSDADGRKLLPGRSRKLYLTLLAGRRKPASCFSLIKNLTRSDKDGNIANVSIS